MNLIEQFALSVIAPILNNVAFAQFGCTATVLRKVSTRKLDGKTVHTYADDPDATLLNVALLDPEAATKQKLYGLLETSTAMLVIPRQPAGMIDVETLDGIRIESGANVGMTFVADAKGLRGIGAATNVPLSESPLVMA